MLPPQKWGYSPRFCRLRVSHTISRPSAIAYKNGGNTPVFAHLVECLISPSPPTPLHPLQPPPDPLPGRSAPRPAPLDAHTDRPDALQAPAGRSHAAFDHFIGVADTWTPPAPPSPPQLNPLPDHLAGRSSPCPAHPCKALDRPYQMQQSAGRQPQGPPRYRPLSATTIGPPPKFSTNIKKSPKKHTFQTMSCLASI